MVGLPGPVEELIRRRFPAFTDELSASLQTAIQRYGQPSSNDAIVDRISLEHRLRVSDFWPAQEARNTVISDLADRFGLASAAVRRRELWRRFLQDIEEYRDELGQLTARELSARLWHEDDPEETYGALEVDDFILDEWEEAEKQPALERWMNLPLWHLSEAAALSVGLNPGVFDPKEAPTTNAGKQLRSTYWARVDLIKRGITAGLLHEPLVPAEVIGWLAERDGIVPSAVLNYAQVLGGLGDQQKCAALIADYRSRIEKFESEKSIGIDDSKIGGSRIDTLYKLILGMAVTRFGHSTSSKKGAAKAVAAEITRIGLSLDDDTTRKVLNRAAEKLDFSQQISLSRGSPIPLQFAIAKAEADLKKEEAEKARKPKSV